MKRNVVIISTLLSFFLFGLFSTNAFAKANKTRGPGFDKGFIHGQCDQDNEKLTKKPKGPGFWKQRKHFRYWNVYTPDMKWSDVFGESITIFGKSNTVRWKKKRRPVQIEDPTLLQALQANGRGVNKMARFAVAELLNSVIPINAPPASDEIASLKIPNVTILSVSDVDDEGNPLGYCLVLGVIDTEIKFEVKLPPEWNEKFYMGGGGGFVGDLQSQGWEAALPRGYATAGTDTGHEGSSLNGTAFLNNMDRVVDWAYRAVHMTAATAKIIISAYYNQDIKYSYFGGCSTGGRQAMMESQKYPNDFDGLIAGAPAYYGANGVSGWAISQSALYPKPFSSPVVPFSKMQLIDDAVLAMCDGIDGVADGLLTDPRNCGFDLETDLPMCDDDVDPGDNSCFTTAEIVVLKKLYGYDLFSYEVPWVTEYPFGGEIDYSNWDFWVIGGPQWFDGGNSPNIQYNFTAHYFKYIYFNDPDYDIHDFDPDNPEDMATIQPVADMVNATETDLSAFEAAGGKMIMYNGWSDPCISPLGTVKYYEDVVDDMGNVDNFFRLYMLPGVGHCGGGRGPGNAGIAYLTGKLLTALEEWVENDEAPENILSEHYTATGEVDLARPICPYPQAAVWDGVGDPNEASSFTCQ